MRRVFLMLTVMKYLGTMSVIFTVSQVVRLWLLCLAFYYIFNYFVSSHERVFFSCEVVHFAMRVYGHSMLEPLLDATGTAAFASYWLCFWRLSHGFIHELSGICCKSTAYKCHFLIKWVHLIIYGSKSYHGGSQNANVEPSDWRV